MATIRQISANRRNARLSTGPRTDAGKAASSQNAITHGLSARSVLVEGESATAYETHCSDLYAYFLPRNEYARSLVDILADKLWRLKRIPRLESLLLEVEEHKFKGSTSIDPAGRAKAEFEASKPGINILRSLTDYILPNDAFAKLSRYESTLLREVERLRRMLKEERGPYNDTGRFAGGLNVTPQEEGKALSRMLHAGKQKPTRRPPRT